MRLNAVHAASTRFGSASCPTTMPSTHPQQPLDGTALALVYRRDSHDTRQTWVNTAFMRHVKEGPYSVALGQMFGTLKAASGHLDVNDRFALRNHLNKVIDAYFADKPITLTTP